MRLTLPNNDPPPGSKHRNLIAGAWRKARVQIGPALAAHGAASALVALASPAPLLTAIVATLTFAGAWLYAIHRMGPDAGQVLPSSWRDLYCAAFTGVGVLLGAWIIAALVGDAGAYYCAPTVPWRIEIALFGSFSLGLLTRMARARGLTVVTYPLTFLALFWIAPFYGYFSGPVFLGISMIADCVNRSVVQLCMVALGMAAGKSLGSTLASWLLKQP